MKSTTIQVVTQREPIVKGLFLMYSAVGLFGAPKDLNVGWTKLKFYL